MLPSVGRRHAVTAATRLVLRRSLVAIHPPATVSRRTEYPWSLQQQQQWSTPRYFSSQPDFDDAALDQMIAEQARQPQTSVSLHTLLRTGQGDLLDRTFGEETRSRNAATDLVLIQVAGFLRRELPIRLAHRIRDLDSVPILKDIPSIVGVKDLYRRSFAELMALPSRISSIEQEALLAATVEGIYERHANVIVQMAQGAFAFRRQVRTETRADAELQESTHQFLDRFYICRIGIRVLIGQYLALRQPAVENYTGIICSQTSPYEIVKRAIDDAAFMCTRKYGDAPEVIMSGRLDLTFPYVPTHLRKSWNVWTMVCRVGCVSQLYLVDYIMLELLKNSMRATVEWHGIDADYPPIKVIIADGDANEDVVIKVSDEGGGIPRSNMKKIWSYLFTTADPSVQEGMVGGKMDHGIDAPLAGLGYGLPISRSYARYFGGDISIMSMEGYGTDAFVYLMRLGDSREPLPI